MGTNTKLRKTIYEKLILDMNNGNIVPGQKLNERELAKKFHASRTPVREALAALEKDGAVDIIHNKGAVVRRVTVKESEEIFDLISLLEVYAIEIAIARGITEKDRIYIKNLEKQMDLAVKDRDYFKFPQINEKFHGFFVNKTGNKTLQKILKQLNALSYSGALSVPKHIEDYMAKHRMIIDALFKGQSNKAVAAMKQHNQDRKIFVSKTLRSIKRSF
jgi:DNA-binding GntR family transcriptional regulator